MANSVSVKIQTTYEVSVHPSLSNFPYDKEKKCFMLEATNIKAFHQGLLTWAEDVAKAAGIFVLVPENTPVSIQGHKKRYGAHIEQKIVDVLTKEKKALTLVELCTATGGSFSRTPKYISNLITQKKIEAVRCTPPRYAIMPSSIIT